MKWWHIVGGIGALLLIRRGLRRNMGLHGLGSSVEEHNGAAERAFKQSEQMYGTLRRFIKEERCYEAVAGFGNWSAVMGSGIAHATEVHPNIGHRMMRLAMESSEEIGPQIVHICQNPRAQG